ncbi:MAG: hypothetical protein ACERLG_12600 [Sedimentibacter sp.]
MVSFKLGQQAIAVKTFLVDDDKRTVPYVFREPSPMFFWYFQVINQIIKDYIKTLK